MEDLGIKLKCKTIRQAQVMMQNLKVVKFRKEHAKESCELILNSFKEFVGSDFNKQATEKFIKMNTEQGVIKKANEPERTNYVALLNSKVVGVIQVRGLRKITLFFVNKKHHQKGVGKALLKKVESLFIKQNKKTIYVWASRYAIHIYAKLGFKKTCGFVKNKTNGAAYQPMKKVLI